MHDRSPVQAVSCPFRVVGVRGLYPAEALDEVDAVYTYRCWHVPFSRNENAPGLGSSRDVWDGLLPGAWMPET